MTMIPGIPKGTKVIDLERRCGFVRIIGSDRGCAVCSRYIPILTAWENLELGFGISQMEAENVGFG